MPKRISETSAVAYLNDIMRSRTPGYIPDGSVSGDVEWPQPARGRSSKEATDIENQVDELLSQAIPATPAHNKQRLYALNAVFHGNFDDVNAATESAKILPTLERIHAQSPQFPTTTSPNVVADVHEKLQRYAKIIGGDPREFPYPEILGHRRDQLHLNKFDENYSNARFVRDSASQKANLKEINALLDRIVPDGAYFNSLRQQVLDEILENGEAVSHWARRELEIAEMRTKTGDAGFVPNSYHYGKVRVINALEQKISPWREDLQREERLQPQRRLTPDNAITIAGLIARHCRLTEQHREHGRNFVSLPEQLPEGIKNSVLRATPQQVRTNRIAKQMAGRVLDAMDAVVGPRRGNFLSRARFLKTVSEHREHWLQPGCLKESEHPALNSLTRTYARILNAKEQEMGRLAQTIENYHCAWRGELRELPQNPKPNLRAASASIRTSQNRSARHSSGSMLLAKAANAPGQQKLNCTLAEIHPSGSAIIHSSTAGRGARGDTNPGNACESRKRSRGIEERDRGKSESR
ncbi:hypothetical protein [Ensifer aridi]|uniref:hypothetical protein n=1 Tax=Ensifer aridi TaxID=1708715 RepID=UPI000A104515|nr:hypothetical protein [Ensifer aridi]